MSAARSGDASPYSALEGPAAVDDPGLVSVVICTRDRPALLDRCLETLAAQDDRDFEIVIVDNSAHTTLPGRVFADGNIRVVREPRLGLSYARNRGVTEARGEVVAFIDDDCEAAPQWVRSVREAFRSRQTMCVTGRVRPLSLDRASHRWFENFSTFDRGGAPRRFVHEPGSFVYPHLAAELGSGCNMAFRREVFDQVGGFDTALDVGLVRGGGDLDLLARVLNSGRIAVYAPCAEVHHHHRDTVHALAWQLFGYGVGIGALSVKHALEGGGKVSAILAFHRRWIVGMIRMVLRRSKRGRPFGFFLLALLVAGDVCSPVPYLWYRWTRNRRVT